MFRHSTLLFHIIMFALIPTLASSGLADWTPVSSSPEAGIDSLERVLIISDYRDSTFFGRFIFPMGDVNGDGFSDIIGARMTVVSRNQDDSMFLFYGGPLADGAPEAAYDTEVLTGGPTNPAWGLKFDVGDISGDGVPDLGISRQDFPVCEFHYWNNGFSDPPSFSIPGHWSIVPTAGDLNDDGELDIALSLDMSGSGGNTVHVYSIGDSFDTIPEYTITDTLDRFARRLAIGDINGDSIADLIVSTLVHSIPDTAFIKFYWGGTDFDTIADYVMVRASYGFGEILYPTGDLNADGFDDLYISGRNDDAYGIYFGGPEFDDEIDVSTPDLYVPPTDIDSRGDFNNDGYADLLLGKNATDLGIEDVLIFLGGPDMDSVYDVKFSAWDLPGLQLNIGLSVAAIGDFTGDGIDDFAVHSRNSTGSGGLSSIEIFAGWDATATDVEYDYEPTIPSGYDLAQNYPNPFNPSTTIQFALPLACQTSLVIYNILGEKVRELIKKNLPAGTYSVSWDGRSEVGSDVPSGVYLYNLSAGDQTLSKKMVLVR